MAKYLTIAKNEYLQYTSFMKEYRKYFPLIVLILFFLYLFLLAPALVDLIMDNFDVPDFFISLAASALMRIILFTFFLYFLLFPITTTLKEIDMKEYEIFIKTPVKSSNVLLGKFLGVLPLYAIGIAVITGFMAAFLLPLGLNFIQIIIIILTFILTLISAVWIGTVIAASLKTKLGRVTSGKDIGKAISFLIALPLIAMMYAIIGGKLTDALVDPNTSGMVKDILMIFPSSWGAELIFLFTNNPGNFSNIFLESVLNFGGLLLFFILSLWIGTKISDRIYTLEITTFTSQKVKSIGYFYKLVYKITGGKSFGTLVVSIFKDYNRRFENLSKIIYMVGVLFLIRLLVSDDTDIYSIVIMSIMLFPILSALVSGEITIRGKENLFIYRKAPIGEGKFILARIIQVWLVVVPIAVIYLLFSSIFIPNISMLTVTTYTLFILLYTTFSVILSLGLFLIRPVFTDKPADLFINIQIIIFITIGILIFMEILLETKYVLEIALLIYSSISLITMYIGYHRLKNIE